MKVVILGGGTSGTLCAWELRKQNKDCEITLVEESNHTQYSPCAMPYVISGEVPKENIILLKKEDYANNNINILLNTKTEKIVPEKNQVLIKKDDKEQELEYDFLVIALGSESFNPGIKLETNNCSFFKTIDDMDAIIEKTENKKNITIIGGGFIGVESAVALKEKDSSRKITMIEAKNQLLPEMLDVDMATLVEEHLSELNITILKEEFVSKITDDLIYTNKQELKSDFSIISVGVRPNMKIVSDAGIKCDKGIITDEYQRTNYENIYACGDCAEITNNVLKSKILSGLANTAYAQAKVVAKNILNNKSIKISGTVNSSISKISDIYIGNSGITSNKAKDANKKIISSRHTSFTTSEYYAKNKKITIKLICDYEGEILGSQMFSDENISGRLCLMNLVIKKGLMLQELADLETPYNPASNPLHDPLITTAKILLKKLNIVNKKTQN